MKHPRLQVVIAVLAILCCTTTSTYATVWTVDANFGPGATHFDVQSAVWGSANGDTILVRPGTYPSAVVQSKSLRIIGDGDGVVKVEGLSVRTMSKSQPTLIRGLLIRAKKSDSLEIKNNDGPVFVEECEIIGAGGDNLVGKFSHPNGWLGVHVKNSRAVTFSRCLLRGGGGPDLWKDNTQSIAGNGGDALYSESSRIAFYQSVARGGDGGTDYDDGGYGGGGGEGALIANQSDFFADGSTFAGGDAGYGDCAYCGGSGGHGLWAYKENIISHRDCFFRGGDAKPGGSAGKAGSSVSDPIRGAKRSLSISSPNRESSTTTLELTGNPGDLFLLLGSKEQDFTKDSFASGVLVPFAAPPLMIPTSVGTYTLPSSGIASLQLAIPALPASVLVEHRWVQAIVLGKQGGVPVLSSPSEFTVLDAAY